MSMETGCAKLPPNVQRHSACSWRVPRAHTVMRDALTQASTYGALSICNVPRSARRVAPAPPRAVAKLRRAAHPLASASREAKRRAPPADLAHGAQSAAAHIPQRNAVAPVKRADDAISCFFR